MSGRGKQKGVRQKGWLNKRGGRIHTWHKRWFVLTGDLLFYYKSPQESRPTGTIPLAGNRVVRHADEPKQANAYKFEIIAGNAGQGITSNHETYLISAESAELADQWVAAIRRVMHEPYGGGMFGRSLEETMEVEARLGGTYVPILLHRCVKFIREHGLHEVGIFRLPGQASRIQNLKDLYDSGSQEDFSAFEDVHTVASLLKLYLRELPEPVVPYVLYNSYKEALKDYFAGEGSESEGPEASERLEQLKRLLIQLPVANFNVLKYMSRFLHEVAAYSEENKMNCMNLGTIFGPHLLRPQTNDPHVLMECNHVSTDFVRALLSDLNEFFPLTNDERTPKRLSVVFQPDVIPPWLREPDPAPPLVVKRSLYQPKNRYITFRPRQNSAPTSNKGKFSGKVASMVEQFNNFKSTSKQGDQVQSSRSVEITGPIMDEVPLAKQAILTRRSLSPEKEVQPLHTSWKNNPIFASSEDEALGEEDEEVPEIIKRLSQNGLPASKQLSDTLSSDMIVNSISNELEGLEQQLLIAKEEIAQYKKSARLWKSRYQLEHRSRIAAEQRISDLQALVDETFQQFALDDSEDDFEDSDNTTALESMLPPHYRASQPLLSLPVQPLAYRSPLKTYLSSPALTK